MSNPFASSVVSSAPVGASSPGFGIAMAVTYNASGVFGVGEFLRSYAGYDEVIADFPSLTGPEALFAAAAFAQSRRPEVIAFGRGALPPTQRYALSALAATALATYPLNVQGDGVTSTEIELTLPAGDVVISAVTNASDLLTSVAHGMTTGDGPYRLTNSGGGLPAGSAVDTNYWIIVISADTFKLAATRADAIATTPVVNLTSDGTGTHTLRRVTNDTLMAQLVQALNDVPGKNYTATQVTGTGETDTILITASAAGEWFSVEVPDHALALMSIAQTHADPGIATDLAAIVNAGGEWYELHQLYNSKAMVVAAAAYIEAQTDPRRIYAAVSSNSVEATTAQGTGGESIRDALETAGYARTTWWWNPAPRTFIDAAVAGRVLPLLPGSVDLVAKDLVGDGLAVNLTTTQKTNIAGRVRGASGGRGNYYQIISGVGVTVGGKTASGEWWFVVRNDDSVNADMIISLFNWRRANDIVRMDDPGIASGEGEVRAVLDRAVKAGIYLNPVVVSKTLAQMLPADVLAGNLPISWSATRVRAVVFVAATGTVS